MLAALPPLLQYVFLVLSLVKPEDKFHFTFYLVRLYTVIPGTACRHSSVSSTMSYQRKGNEGIKEIRNTLYFFVPERKT
jgi:hypothetical protein